MVVLEPLTDLTVDRNELPFVVSYLAALTGLFWLGHMVGAHVQLVHAV